MNTHMRPLPVQPQPHPDEHSFDEDGHETTRELQIVNSGDFQHQRWSLATALHEHGHGRDFTLYLVNQAQGQIAVTGWGLQLGWVDPYQARVMYKRIAERGGWYAMRATIYYSKTRGEYQIDAWLAKNQP